MNNINEGKLWELIALLREHCRKHYGFKDNDDIEIDHDSVQFHLYHNAKRCFSIGSEKVICKEFGFIKRLVENDKIELPTQVSELTLELRISYVLKSLSIQDNPIEFLVSILK